jgi:SAM-dependent methyltransferase
VEMPASLWVCPRCHEALPDEPSERDGAEYALRLESRLVHSSASLEAYASTCPGCGLPYTANGRSRFAYPYRQLLAERDLRRFLRWSAAQNNGFVSYALMRGSSCSIDGREDAAQFANFIRRHVGLSVDTVVDLGCGPLSVPAYLPEFEDARLVGIDPFDSEWAGSFVEGVGEFLPLGDGTVDLVVAATALDHILDLTLALRELARVTRAGGSLVVWDHTFHRQRRPLVDVVVGFLRAPISGKVGQLRGSFGVERVRIYDSGIVLWTPRGYADPFHEPRSRRPSWSGKLRRAIEDAGFELATDDAATGFSHFVRSGVS